MARQPTNYDAWIAKVKPYIDKYQGQINSLNKQIAAIEAKYKSQPRLGDTGAARKATASLRTKLASAQWNLDFAKIGQVEGKTLPNGAGFQVTKDFGLAPGGLAYDAAYKSAYGGGAKATPAVAASTGNAVKDFQRAHGLVVDGIVGPKTLAAGWKGASPSSPTSPGGGTAAAPGAPSPGNNADARAQYGTLAWALDIPEIGDILRNAAANNQAPAITTAQVQNTNWWKTHSSTVRSFYQLQKEDPKSATQKVKAQSDAIRNQAAQLGISLDAKQLDAMAKTSIQTDWTPQQLRTAIGAAFHYKPDAQTGLAATSEQELRSLAGDYYVPLSDHVIGKWLKNILSGNAQTSDYKEYMVSQAKSMYPGLTSALEKGVTVAQYADPYKQVAAKTLEVSPETVDFSQPKWAKALNQIDPKTGERTTMSVADWQTMLQSDPSYGFHNTQQGRDQAYALIDNLQKTYGATA